MPTSTPIAHASPEHLAREPRVAAALSWLRAHEEETLAEQIAFCEVPAPPFNEQARGAHLISRLKAEGVTEVRQDSEGNVIARLSSQEDWPLVVVAAHLDSVFPAEVQPKVQRSGSILRAPGIGDNARGLASMLMLARVLREVGVRPRLPLVLVGTVGEEGAGNLRGVRHLLAHEIAPEQIGAFLVVDGLHASYVTASGQGVIRERVTCRGPGGHSYVHFGRANPIYALGRALAEIATLASRLIPAPGMPGTAQAPAATCSVTRMGGGTSINALPEEAWFEIDLRAADAQKLAEIHRAYRVAVERAVRSEQGRSAFDPPDAAQKLSLTFTALGERPAGRMPADAPLVRAALAAARYVANEAHLGEPASCDVNIPLSLGVPGVVIGGGGSGGDTHALSEWYDATNSFQGPQLLLLLSLMIAGLAESNNT
ncbi:MAG TPA: M20/M25/M40 family metallo-hydrolase [Ktedonobacterales bacterium]|jgi:acetylornithine deacetylase/succinyl-diaminopimelate desuccinylase-like protein